VGLIHRTDRTIWEFTSRKERGFAHSPLSNFWPESFVVPGLGEVPTGEHAFAALKTLDEGERAHILGQPTPGKAKREGRSVTLQADWEQIKYDQMVLVQACKFRVGTTAADYLIDTGDKLLIEGNNWNDHCWGATVTVSQNGGTLTYEGRNWLGHILMAQRARLISL
jgi:hypothetical protein